MSANRTASIPYGATVVCKSQQGELLKVSKCDIEERFWDSTTQEQFLRMVQTVRRFRLDRIQKIAEDQNRMDAGIVHFYEQLELHRHKKVLAEYRERWIKDQLYLESNHTLDQDTDDYIHYLFDRKLKKMQLLMKNQTNEPFRVQPDYHKANFKKLKYNHPKRFAKKLLTLPTHSKLESNHSVHEGSPNSYFEYTPIAKINFSTDHSTCDNNSTFITPKKKIS